MKELMELSPIKFVKENEVEELRKPGKTGTETFTEPFLRRKECGEPNLEVLECLNDTITDCFKPEYDNTIRYHKNCYLFYCCKGSIRAKNMHITQLEEHTYNYVRRP